MSLKMSILCFVRSVVMKAGKWVTKTTHRETQKVILAKKQVELLEEILSILRGDKK